MTWRNYKDKLRRYFWFSREELVGFLVTVAALGFVVSFTWWGEQAFDLQAGLLGFLKGTLFVAVALFVHHAGQRLAGIAMGFRVEQKLWWYGIVGSLIFVFVTNGSLKFMGGSATNVHFLPQHRLGKFRFHINLSEVAKVCAAGPLANILFAGLVKTLSLIHLFPGALADQLFTFNVVFAAWNLIPIPPLDGSKVMFYSRLTYAFLFGTVASYAFMVYVLDVYSYILALLFGVLTWLLTLIFVEAKLTK